jgi:glucokinase
MQFIAGDIGGTKTILAYYESTEDPRSPARVSTYSSRKHAGLESILELFISDLGVDVDRISLGVAGPVVAGKSRVTNLDWSIDASIIRQRFDLERVDLLNDLESIANAVPILAAGDLVYLQEGEAEPGGAIAVVAPGTGLGEAFLTWDGQGYRAHPSEGGHADFAPSTPEEMKLLEFLRARFKHVSFERVCSGSGLPNIYDFYRQMSDAAVPDWLAEALEGTEDPTPIIVQTAMDTERTCEICRATLRTFVSVLGSETANMALKVFATGGVYLGGGIPPKILPRLQDGLFLEAFTRKGRFSELLHTVPVAVILQEKAALFGAARYCAEL